MIDDTMAARMVMCGWIAAVAAGGFMAVLSLMVGFPAGFFYLGGGAALIALAYGIYRRSRICAVLVLLNHFLGIAKLFREGGNTPPAMIAVTLVLGVLYLLGVIGTFVHHARRGPAAA